MGELPFGMRVLERGWLSSNCVLFSGGAKTSLVDSGYYTHADQTLAMVEAILGQKSLDCLINTHLHSDHCGGNATLQARYPKLRTLIPPGQANDVRNWDPVALSYAPTGQHCPPFKFSTTLKSGELIYLGHEEWEIYSAPGHDPDAIILFEPKKRILISGDALWERGFGVIFPELEGKDGFAEVTATLDQIEQLEPRLVIPGHGRVFAYTPQIMEYARQRLIGFRDDPVRHARHAAKVLLKFKLLEQQSQKLNQFVDWSLNTPCLIEIHRRFFHAQSTPSWVLALCDDLIKSGAARLEGSDILNA